MSGKKHMTIVVNKGARQRMGNRVGVLHPGYISAGKGSDKKPCQDICVPTEGIRKNDCKCFYTNREFSL
ncbi:MAG: hypothetical protein LBV74_17860 [Tannerella sp.]|nr:hypothetical protein [Tannerella sp.]